jgi:paraquat-inducible protein A
MPHTQHLTACHDCDLLIEIPTVPNDFNAVCPRCGHVLHEAHPNAVERGLALSIAGLLLFPFANLLPLISISRMGLNHSGTIAEGIYDLFVDGFGIMGALVLFSAVLAPLIEISLIFTITSHLWLGKRPAYLLPLMRSLHQVREWSMLEVMMMGILVSMVKLKDIALLELGVGLLCFILTLLCAISIQWLVNEAELWDAITEPKNKMVDPTAPELSS